MKKYIPYIIAALLLVILFPKSCNDRAIKNEYEVRLQKKDSVINIQKYVISELLKKMELDSIEYEKEKEHIKELRDRYPDNALLDSLFSAGQSID